MPALTALSFACPKMGPPPVLRIWLEAEAKSGNCIGAPIRFKRQMARVEMGFTTGHAEKISGQALRRQPVCPRRTRSLERAERGLNLSNQVDGTSMHFSISKEVTKPKSGGCVILHTAVVRTPTLAETRKQHKTRRSNTPQLPRRVKVGLLRTPVCA